MTKATNLAYLIDTYSWNGQGLVLDIIPCTLPPNKILGTKNIDTPIFTVLLDTTLLYPQGGGQPSDKGQLIHDKGDHKVTFFVEHVSMKGEIVEHHGYFENGMLDVGNKVDIQVDGDYRMLNSRLHTAGHLIFSMIKKLELPLIEKKGYHFVDGPYVEFSGIWPTDLTKENFELKVNEAITENLEVTTRYAGQEDGVQENEENPMRYVTIGELTKSPCGGTHVRNISELGRVTIRKIKTSKGVTKISYELV
ncbi:hypothetical protein K7432_001090 [Basidiobolus ranarum]|uniref:Threonyl/alanyl tRNA synthetase SAD domain-containing protein n=1 Tax=Basidiobolus ranarum TaxID=34480 RepID=A0ABR2X3Q0_9FUNG